MQPAVVIHQVKDIAAFQAPLEHIYPEHTLALKMRENVPSRGLESLWIASVDNIPVGRLSIYRNDELRYHGLRTFCIGHYECIHEEKIAHHLLQHAINCIQAVGGEYVVGPMNGSTWENYRFATTNKQTFFLEPLQWDYYLSQWLTYGFDVIARYESHLDEQLWYDEALLQAALTRLAASSIHIRKTDLAQFRDELPRLYKLCAGSFASNFLYTPISEDDFIQKYLPVEPYLDADLFWIACDATHKAVGFIFALPDYNDTTSRTAIVKTLCRLPGAMYQSIIPAIGNQLVKSARQKGYQRIIHAFMHQQNQSMQVSTRFSGSAFKEYRLLGKVL